MKTKILCAMIIGCLLTFSFIATSISQGSNWWDKFGEPKYGGTINMRVAETSSLQLDPYGPPYFEGNVLLWYESLFSTDWTLDRNVYPFTTDFTPQKYSVGLLAESWEQTGPKTVIVKIRKGIHWHNKPPVNGRELTANDVQQHYNRLAGMGDGFTIPSLFWSYFTNLLEGVKAIDKYTVEFNFQQANALNLPYLMDTMQNNLIEAPEWVALAGPPPKAPAGGPPGGEKGGPPPPPPPPGPGSRVKGPLNDWTNVVGTGPWMITNFVDGSTLNFEKNSDYWGYDERYPQNRLPYADKLNVLVIPDDTTALAALRTGKLDILSNVNWQVSKTLSRTNPDLKQSTMPDTGPAVLFNLNNSPFTDINVRKALQMAIDRQAMAKSLYGGIVDGTPCGPINPALGEYCYSYKDWPKELQEGYSYNPEKAKELLAAAGYPDGFKTNIVSSNIAAMDSLQVIKAQFMDIGVDMEVKLFDMATYTNIIMTAKHEGMVYTPSRETGATGMPWQTLQNSTSFFTNPSTVNDPVYDDMVRNFSKAPDLPSVAKQCVDAQRYALEHYWKIFTFPTVSYIVNTPSLKGYSGELLRNQYYYARWWKDK